MHELDRHPAEEFFIGGCSLATRCAGKRKKGSKSLSTGMDQVGRDLVQEVIAHNHGLRQKGLKTSHIALYLV